MIIPYVYYHPKLRVQKKVKRQSYNHILSNVHCREQQVAPSGLCYVSSLSFQTCPSCCSFTHKYVYVGLHCTVHCFTGTQASAAAHIRFKAARGLANPIRTSLWHEANSAAGDCSRQNNVLSQCHYFTFLTFLGLASLVQSILNFSVRFNKSS